MNAREFYQKVINDLMLVSLATWVVLVVADLLKPGFSTNYLNMNLWLVGCILVVVVKIAVRSKI